MVLPESSFLALRMLFSVQGLGKLSIKLDGLAVSTGSWGRFQLMVPSLEQDSVGSLLIPVSTGFDFERQY